MKKRRYTSHDSVFQRPFPADSVAPLADVLDGTFDSSAAHSRGTSAASYPANGMLPDIGLGTNQNPLFAERPVGVDVSQNAQAPAEAAPAMPEAAAEADGDLDSRALREAERVDREAEDGGGDGERQVAAPAPEAAVDEAAQSRLERVRQQLCRFHVPCVPVHPPFWIILSLACQ